jgi:ParB/RepB/Spo0J family partition protein
MKSKYQLISPDRIKDPERPLRSDLSPESVADLVVSIKAVGIIEPLVVKCKGDNFEVVAGHRRLVAAEIVGLLQIPCIVLDINDLDGEVLKLHENLARSEINPFDWANHLKFLKEQFKLTNSKIAELLGMSDAWVTQHLEILEYPPELTNAVKQAKLSFTVARELVQIKDVTKRKVYINAAASGGCSPDLAIRWRKEANSQGPRFNQENLEEEPAPATEFVPVRNLTCPVCHEEILPEQQVTLVIHGHCQPA